MYEAIVESMLLIFAIILISFIIAKLVSFIYNKKKEKENKYHLKPFETTIYINNWKQAKDFTNFLIDNNFFIESTEFVKKIRDNTIKVKNE